MKSIVSELGNIIHWVMLVDLSTELDIVTCGICASHHRYMARVSTIVLEIVSIILLRLHPKSLDDTNSSASRAPTCGVLQEFIILSCIPLNICAKPLRWIVKYWQQYIGGTQPYIPFTSDGNEHLGNGSTCLAEISNWNKGGWLNLDSRKTKVSGGEMAPP